MTTPLYTFLLAVAAVAQLALLCAAAPHIVQRVTSLCRPRTGRLVGLLLVWYGTSAVTSITTKEILRSFPFPITLAVLQQLVAAAGGVVAYRASIASTCARGKICEDSSDSSARARAVTVLPVAAVMVGSLVTYRWSLMSVSVKFVHTVKTLGPVFTILFSRVMLKERLSASRSASVVPVMVGVAITSITEAEFALVGFLAALTSTVCQALQAVLTKTLLEEGVVRRAQYSPRARSAQFVRNSCAILRRRRTHASQVRKAELFYVAAVFAFVLLLPLFFFLDAWRLTPLDRRTAGVLLLNCACSWLNQYTGLSVLDAMSSPLSHSLANVMKRAAVITVAMLLAQKPVTLLHLFGVGLSVFGAFVYQQLAAWRRSASYERLPLIGEGSPQPSFEAGAAAPGAVTPLPPAVNGGGGGIGGGTATARIFATLSTDTAGIALGARPGGRDFRPAGGAPETPG